ncbi:TrkH family potassium uptake protein [Vagococcus lutrae]|uniref:TrkH family potassium uptake protein n=1 Tax=Vagococcus lutrae TaxID=81947 RepID=UPI0020974D8F|nr:TrkH family potassium uptake protein [Vagococcus lutrae]MCO7150941.1 TrkH family potassium uptake protein [Vagococcus lutrae]MDT2808070.1 TrkH family potassium uptake protein [Vagococcus lutrae]MDT2812414.1 TrkH family potassium uptake protein [Vagococcus lutrae]MDT2819183.1 TrkH family potassium uptake protein [Vagococcus lutrae]MDT2844082.1 TrkH family potassium uptake protein [Vagococcus lutrae]
MIKKNKQPKANYRFTPVQAITASFLMVIVIGTFLLSLPISSNSGHTNLSDAAFVATSSVCVTGLTTVNTAAHWSLFGRIVIMCLIEIGGMSFMLMTLIVVMFMRKKVNFQARLIFKESLNLGEYSGVLKLGLYVLKFSFVTQMIGTILFSFYFIPKHGVINGLGHSVFHAISAYCNAGFDLFGNSLEGVRTNSYFMLVVSGLIIAGGLGFVVWRDLLTWYKRRKMTLHTQLTLRMTIIILISSFILFLLFENNLQAYSDQLTPFQRIVNTFFLAVTPRTAGFNSIPYADLSHASLLLTMMLMFVGGNSGSTAGGLKVSTLGVLLLHAWATIKGKNRTVFHYRTIKQEIVMRAFALFFICVTITITATALLSVTEVIPREFGIEYVAFEVFSAFGTVGVTLGLTPHLTMIGKLVIMLLMFIGRVGVYTFLLSIAGRQRNNEGLIRYPEEHVMVG